MHRYLYVCTYQYVSIYIYEYMSSIRSKTCTWYLHRMCYHEQEMYFCPSRDKKKFNAFFLHFSVSTTMCVFGAHNNTYARTHKHTEWNTYTYLLLHTHTQTHTLAHTWTHTQTHTHTLSHVHTWFLLHTRTHTRTHTHVNTIHTLTTMYMAYR